MSFNTEINTSDSSSSVIIEPDKWDPVSTSRLTDIQRQKFNDKKRALQMYASGDYSISEITIKTKLCSSALFYLLKRSKVTLPDGSQAGYLACIPNLRLKKYERRSKSARGTAGLLRQFLNAHPEQKKLLDQYALGEKKLNGATIRGNYFKEIWLAFRAACKEAGIDVSNDYPFCNSDGGREAIRQYVCKLRSGRFVAAARISHGDAAGKLAAADASLVPPVTLVPYQRVQLDAHPIDLILNVQIQDAQGNEQDLPLSRVWLLALVCVASRAVLGYALSLSHNYTSNDVLGCIASAFGPWKPLELPENSLKYHEGAGLPGGVFKACQLRAFDSIQMDNAWSQLSRHVQERIIDAGAIEVITNKPCTPRADAYVERFFRTIESLAFHQYPNTTGDRPSDPRRRKPEKAAKRLNMQYSDLKMAADVVIANYNAKAHSALNGRSPLEYIEYRMNKGQDLIRKANAETIDGLKLYEREFGVSVKANLEQGHKPYIQFKSVRYTGPKLQHRLDLKDTRCVFRVNTKDIRHGYLFDLFGKCIDRISAEPRWLLQPHSIATRRAICKLIKIKELSSSTREPVSDHAGFLEAKATKSRKVRNALVDAREQIVSTDSTGDQVMPSDTTDITQKHRVSHQPKISITKTFSR